jgi:hypothetical protein
VEPERRARGYDVGISLTFALACFAVRFLGQFFLMDTVAILFIFYKYCSIMNYLVLKKLFHKLHVNCIIVFIYVLYICSKINVTENFKKIAIFFC